MKTVRTKKTRKGKVSTKAASTKVLEAVGHDTDSYKTVFHETDIPRPVEPITEAAEDSTRSVTKNPVVSERLADAARHLNEAARYGTWLAVQLGRLEAANRAKRGLTNLYNTARRAAREALAAEKLREAEAKRSERSDDTDAYAFV